MTAHIVHTSTISHSPGHALEHDDDGNLYVRIWASPADQLLFHVPREIKNLIGSLLAAHDALQKALDEEQLSARRERAALNGTPR